MVTHPLRLIALVTVLLSLVTLVFAPARAQQETTGDVHVIQVGENLFRIALQYGLSTDELAAANSIVNPAQIYAGQTLIIPSPGGAAAANEPANAAAPAEPAESTTVIVVPAQPESQSEATIIEAEGTDPETDTGIDPAAPATRPIYHTVQRGETLRAIAQVYGTNEVDLSNMNRLANPNRIQAGQQLIVGYEEPRSVPAETAVEVESVPESAETAAEPTIHTVQAGEYISSIARRYNVTNDVIIAANNITNPNQLYAGQQLVIPTNLSPDEVSALVYAPPSAAKGAGREIIVDLSNSRVYAYQDGILMYEAVSSNGLPATPTVQGTFTVQSKVRSQTMSGPGYWLPNVEWVMYFYQGYALHGAYWHSNWGQPMSHGCVNLPNTDARWFYEFAEIGTPVTVQY